MAKKLITYWCIAGTIILPIVLGAHAEFQRGTLVKQLDNASSEYSVPYFTQYVASFPLSFTFFGVGISIITIAASIFGLQRLKNHNSYFSLYLIATLSISTTAMVAFMPGSAFGLLGAAN